MRLGINSVFEHEAPEQWAEILHNKGLTATSFPVNYEASEQLIDAYVKAFHDYGIIIAEVGIWNSPFVPDQSIAEKNKEVCLRQLELAEYVEAKCCVNVSGAAGECWYGCYPENYSKDLYKRNIEFVQMLLDKVKPENTYYTLEPMQWMLPDSTESYLKLIQDVNRSSFAVHFDPVNFVNSPERAMFYSKYRDEAIRELGPYIKSCHLKDFDLKQGLTVQIYETLPGTGRADLASYIKNIDELDSELPMLIEHLSSWEEYDQAITYVKSLIK